MKHLILAVGAACLAPTIAVACPTITTGTQSYTLSEAQLSDPNSINSGAGGTIQLANCGYSGGFVHATPQLSINFVDTQGPVQLSTYSSCDTVLLVNAPDGSWWFDDDSGGDLQAWLLVGVVPGRMDVWVGTYDGNQCDAHLQIN